MPSQTASAALIELYRAIDGAPWCWPTWQQITGVRHGLFPQDDDKLPSHWTREDANDIHSWFIHCHSAGKPENGAASMPGRTKWDQFVLKSWEKWNIHPIIVKELRENNAHPIQILVNEGSKDAKWPNSDSYACIAFEAIGMCIFGDDAHGRGGIFPSSIRNCIGVFTQRSWARIRTQVQSNAGNLEFLENKALAAFKQINEGRVTKAKLDNTVRSVSKWKDTAELWGTTENMDKAGQMMAELERLLEEVGVAVRKSSTQPKAKAGSKQKLFDRDTKALKCLATESDLIELSILYSEYFDVEDMGNDPLVFVQGDLHTKFHDPSRNEDLGIGEESGMDDETLAARLGFIKNRLPVQFNRQRHQMGITRWSNPADFEGTSPEHLKPLSLHWHQLAGIHSIIRSTFTAEPDTDRCTGMLLCDEVGLGKTALVIATIAFLNQSVSSEGSLGRTRGGRLAPVLEGRQFLNGGELEDLPHLIIVPGTLRPQWIIELQTFFLPKSVDILTYDSPKAGNPDFWAPGGPFRASVHEPRNKIIVTTHSSLLNDMQRIYLSRPKKSKDPWVLPELKPGRGPQGTVFSERYLTVVIDEVHEMRNLGVKHFSALRIFKQGLLKLALTATPLLTAPKDIASIGRLIGVREFLTPNSVLEQQEDVAAFRKAKKLDDDGESLKVAEVLAVRRMQSQFRGHMLRRTTDSVDWRGGSLLDLPPHKTISGVLELTKREVGIIHSRAEDARNGAIIANEAAKFIQTRKFYHEYRSAVCYAKENPEDPNPFFKSLDEWEVAKSTKMDVCAKICRHYLSRDDVADVDFKDGQLVLPALDPSASGKPFTQNRRILIYSEFPSMAPILRNALDLHGVDTLSIDGSMSFENRDKVVSKFHLPREARVFLFSSVGSAGLNLSIADVVIFFTQPWSAQDERQIRGRAHRQPQKKVVKTIHLLAADSSDLLMNDMALRKQDMFDAFVNKELGDELRDLLSGKAVYRREDLKKSEDDDLHDGDGRADPPKKTTKRSRAKKEGPPLGPPKAQKSSTSSTPKGRPSDGPDGVPPSQRVPTAALKVQSKLSHSNNSPREEKGGVERTRSESVLSDTAAWLGEIGGALPSGGEAPLEVQGVVEVGRINPLSEIAYGSESGGEIYSGDDMQVDARMPDDNANGGLSETGVSPDPDAPVHDTFGEVSDLIRDSGANLFLADGQWKKDEQLGELKAWETTPLKNSFESLQGGATQTPATQVRNSPHNPFFTDSPCPKPSKKAKVRDDDAYTHQPLVGDLGVFRPHILPTTPPNFRNSAQPTMPASERIRDMFSTNAGTPKRNPQKNPALGAKAAAGGLKNASLGSRSGVQTSRAASGLAANVTSRSSDTTSNSRGGLETPAGGARRAAGTVPRPPHRGWGAFSDEPPPSLNDPGTFITRQKSKNKRR